LGSLARIVYNPRYGLIPSCLTLYGANQQDFNTLITNFEKRYTQFSPGNTATGGHTELHQNWLGDTSATAEVHAHFLMEDDNQELAFEKSDVFDALHLLFNNDEPNQIGIALFEAWNDNY